MDKTKEIFKNVAKEEENNMDKDKEIFFKKIEQEEAEEILDQQENTKEELAARDIENDIEYIKKTGNKAIAQIDKQFEELYTLINENNAKTNHNNEVLENRFQHIKDIEKGFSDYTTVLDKRLEDRFKKQDEINRNLLNLITNCKCSKPLKN